MEIRTQPMVQREQEQQTQPTQQVQQQTQQVRRPGRCSDMQGVLPACAPLANPYVPFQQNNPQTYPAKKGVVRGTLFPGLDLPFMGMVNNRELSASHLHELQALGFAVVELGEYLDTHADDKEALELFRSYVEMYEKGMKEYQQMHGPLMQRESGANGTYDWLKNPWPWDYEANMEAAKED